MLKLGLPLVKQHSFFSEPSKDLPWLRIGSSSSHSRASANPRCGKPSCPSKETTLICGSTPPPASSYCKLRTPYCIVQERSYSSRQPASSEVRIFLLNDRILVCPAIGNKAGLTVIFSKGRTRCAIIGAVFSDQHRRPYLRVAIPEPASQWIDRPTPG